MNKFITQTKLLENLGVSPKSKVYMTAISKLAKLRNGFTHRQKYKNGIYEKYFEPRLNLDLDYIYKNNRVYYNLDSLDKIKSYMIYYITNKDEQNKYLGASKNNNIKSKIYGKEYKKTS